MNIKQKFKHETNVGDWKGVVSSHGEDKPIRDNRWLVFVASVIFGYVITGLIISLY
jgi:hypothetical protein